MTQTSGRTSAAIALIAALVTIVGAAMMLLGSGSAASAQSAGCGQVDLAQPAAAATLNDRFAFQGAQIAADNNAIGVAISGGNRYTLANTDGLDTVSSAQFCVDVDEPGTFTIDASVFGADTRSNSFYVQVDDGPIEVWHFRDSDADFSFQSVTEPNALLATQFELDAGQHTITFLHRESEAYLAAVRLNRIGSTQTTPVPCVAYDELQQAEDGRITGLLISKDGYLTSSAAAGRTYPYAPDTYAEFCITTTVAGNYRMSGTTLALTNLTDSFAIELQDQFSPFAPRFYQWHLAKGPSPRMSDTNRYWYLQPGDHRVRLHLRESQSALDSFRFVAATAFDPSAPLACTATLDTSLVTVSRQANDFATDFEFFAIDAAGNATSIGVQSVDGAITPMPVPANTTGISVRTILIGPVDTGTSPTVACDIQ